jgi:DNA polymerase-3 subunit alpha
MFKILPLFKSHYSLGKSILTLSNDEDVDDRGPDSIMDICSKNELESFFLIDDNMSGFLQAYTNAKENKIKLIYGLRLTICDDREEKNEESRGKCSKIVVLIKNKKGYKKLIKIYSDAATKGFYYEPRTDYSTLKKLWNKNDLKLCVPFYDSFLYRNYIEGKMCVPELDFAEPVFFIEDHSLPFDPLFKEKVESFTKDRYETVNAQSIYYRNKKDFKAYLTFRCINKRSTLEKPQLDHMSSDTFSFENWKEQNEA